MMDIITENRNQVTVDFYSQGLNWLSRAEQSNQIPKVYGNQYLLSWWQIVFREEMSNVAGSAFSCCRCNPRSIPTCCFHHYWANNCPRLMDPFSKEIQKQKHVDTENSDSKEKQRTENIEIKIHNNMLTTIYFAGLEEEFANASQIKKIFYFAINLFFCLISKDSFILALDGLELTLKTWKVSKWFLCSYCLSFSIASITGIIQHIKHKEKVLWFKHKFKILFKKTEL